MKFIKNSIITLAILGIVGLGCSMDVKACPYSSSCGSKDQDIVCGEQRAPMRTGTHVIKEANGYTETCIVNSFNAMHTIKCSGCGHVFATELRTCSIIHSYKYCAPSYGVCQY